MRIISGKFKSRRISAPKKLPVRPTTGLSKESLFNVINNLYDFDEISVLDLFSGTGSISYEFCSRGTQKITCVDANSYCVNFIRKMFAEFEEQAVIIKSDVFKFLELCSQHFTVIFADPPYDMSQEDFTAIANLVFEKQLLEEEGVLVIEHSIHTSFEEHPNFDYQKKYGGTIFSFLKVTATGVNEEE